MPSEHSAGTSTDRETFPRLLDDLGEDPARWLDRDVLSDQDRAEMIKALIRGMDTLERVRAWKAVERALGRGPADGPREGVMRLLEQREAYLESIDGPPLRHQHGPWRPPEMLDTESAIPERERSAIDKFDSMGRTVATDGGADDGE